MGGDDNMDLERWVTSLVPKCEWGYLGSGECGSDPRTLERAVDGRWLCDRHTQNMRDLLANSTPAGDGAVCLTRNCCLPAVVNRWFGPIDSKSRWQTSLCVVHYAQGLGFGVRREQR